MKIILILILLGFASSAEAKFSVKRNSNMDFGVVASSVDGPGTAVIDPNADTKTVTGSISDFGGTVARAKFSISGGTNSGTASIVLPASFTISKSGVTLTVDNLALDTANPVTLNNQGQASFYVSGRLNVTAGQSAQSGLNGSFTVTVVDDASSDTGDASANGSADVAAPIEITSVAALEFGSIQANASAGSLDVNTSGATTAINVTQLAGNTPAPGEFQVTGDGGAAFSISLPSSALMSSAGNTMTINNFQHDAGVTPSLSGGGTRTVKIGARLNVGADQAGGSYSGTYSISVNYN